MTARQPFADALRAIAAVLVVTGQVFTIFPAYIAIHGFDLFGPLFRIGDLGLAIFFALSGYLLGDRYVSAAIDGTSIPHAGRFLRDRFVRIYPAYVCAIICLWLIDAGASFAGAAHRDPPGLRDIVSHLFFVHDFSPQTIESVSPTLWTMPVTVEFYLALPLCAFVANLLIRDMSRIRRLRALGTFGVIALLGSAAMRALLVKAHPWITASSTLAESNLDQLAGLSPLFIAGLAFGPLASTVRPSRRFASAAVVVALVAFVAYARVTSRAPHAPSPISDVWIVIIAGSPFLLAVSAFALLAGFKAIPPGRLRKAFASRWTQLAAALSYSIYLLHDPIVRGIAYPFAPLSSNRAFILALPLALTGSAFVAIFLFAIVEEPCFRWKTHPLPGAGPQEFEAFRAESDRGNRV